MDSNKKLEKISDIIEGLPRLKVFDNELLGYEENNPFQPKYPVVDKNTYLGIEVEVENVERYDSSVPYWRIIEDGSLRNNGREFITPPIRAWRVEHALTNLFEQNLNRDIDFSERTSIHIHMNIRTLTIPQLEALIITYLLFEKSLFTFIGHNRYENIFCVPVTESRMAFNLERLIRNQNPIFSWQKYTAMNLLPISEKGTIEFRHLHGTKDIKKIMTWINLILCLKTFALRNDPDYIWHKVKTLNTSSEYRMFGEEVFGKFIEEIYTPSFNTEIEQTSIYIKNQCISNSFKEELILNFNEKSPLAKYKLANLTIKPRTGWSFLDLEMGSRMHEFETNPVTFDPGMFQTEIRAAPPSAPGPRNRTVAEIAASLDQRRRDRVEEANMFSLADELLRRS